MNSFSKGVRCARLVQQKGFLIQRTPHSGATLNTTSLTLRRNLSFCHASQCTKTYNSRSPVLRSRCCFSTISTVRLNSYEVSSLGKEEQTAGVPDEAAEFHSKEWLNSKLPEHVQIPPDLTDYQYVQTRTESQREEYAKFRMELLTPTEEKRLKVLRLKHQVELSVGKPVPAEEAMTPGRWLLLLLIPQGTKGSQNFEGIMNFFFKTDMQLLMNKRKKEERRRLHEEKKALINYDERPQILRRIGGRTVGTVYRNNSRFAWQFETPLILDMDASFHSSMRTKDMASLNRQLNYLLSANHTVREPFHIHVANVPTEGQLYHMLNKDLAPLDSYWLCQTSEEDFMGFDHLPKEKLVYLSPDSHYVLNKFSHSDIYIMGAITDMGPQEPLTLAKAKRLGIRNARLPVDKYLVFQGKKTFPVHVVMRILLDLKRGKRMRDAIADHVPTRVVQRYLEVPDEDEMEDEGVPSLVVEPHRRTPSKVRKLESKPPWGGASGGDKRKHNNNRDSRVKYDNVNEYAH